MGDDQDSVIKKLTKNIFEFADEKGEQHNELEDKKKEDKDKWSAMMQQREEFLKRKKQLIE